MESNNETREVSTNREGHDAHLGDTQSAAPSKSPGGMAAAARLHPHPILQFAPDGALLDGNAAAHAVAASMGMELHQCMVLPAIRQWVQGCWKSGQTECRMERLGSGHPFSWTFVPDATAGMVHCFLADLTESQKLQEQLLHTQRLESIGRLAVGVAHDFNNLLTVIQGNTQILIESARDSETAALLEAVEDAALRAGSVTRHLLVLSRKHVFQAELLDLNQLVQNIAKLLRRVLGEDIRLELQLCSETPALAGDPCMLEQIILTLAINARDAMPAGGRLLVATSIHRFDHLSGGEGDSTRSGFYVSLHMTHHGSNDGSERASRLSMLFSNANEQEHADGLGLSAIQGIVQQHKGWMAIETERGRGQTVDIFLPASSRQAQTQTAVDGDAKAQCGTETVLLVEDEKPLRALVRHVLVRHGYKVLEAESGLAAVQIWEQHKTEIELLLTDIIMPEGINGRQLAARLKTERPALKVLYTSGYNEEIAGEHFTLQPGVNFLRKPFHPTALLEAIRRCLDALPS
jgi:two-component system, cell cycle sensor histidine kinase and response regulator CckA